MRADVIENTRSSAGSALKFLNSAALRCKIWLCCGPFGQQVPAVRLENWSPFPRANCPNLLHVDTVRYNVRTTNRCFGSQDKLLITALLLRVCGPLEALAMKNVAIVFTVSFGYFLSASGPIAQPSGAKVKSAMQACDQKYRGQVVGVCGKFAKNRRSREYLNCIKNLKVKKVRCERNATRGQWSGMPNVRTTKNPDDPRLSMGQ